jgi:hypothetical protein
MTPETDAEVYQPAPRPALDVPGLIAPKVGFGSKYKKQPVGFAAGSESTDSSASHEQHVGKVGGFIRRRPGFQEPPSTEGGVLYGDENGTVDGTGNNGGLGTLSTNQAMAEVQDNRVEQRHEQEPLFLEHDEDDGHDDDRDLDSNASRHDPIPDSTALITPATGLSGAQLCNNLLQSVANLPVPIKTARSRREEKREEMARRIKEREETGTPFLETGGVRLTDKVHELGHLFDEIEDEGEEGVEVRPTMSQLKRRKAFRFGLGLNDQASLEYHTQVNHDEVDQGPSSCVASLIWLSS